MDTVAALAIEMRQKWHSNSNPMSKKYCTFIPCLLEHSLFEDFLSELSHQALRRHVTWRGYVSAFFTTAPTELLDDRQQYLPVCEWTIQTTSPIKLSESSPSFQLTESQETPNMNHSNQLSQFIEPWKIIVNWCFMHD